MLQDIIGAAETGSGKTLAFGLPILHHILREGGGGGPSFNEAKRAKAAASKAQAKGEAGDGEGEGEGNEEVGGKGLSTEGDDADDDAHRLRALIIAPTRELALQVRRPERVGLVGSHGMWKRPCLQTAHMTI